MKQEVKQVIRNLIKETKKAELIYYKVASDNFWINFEKDFSDGYKKSDLISNRCREDGELEDFGYFSAIREIFDEYINTNIDNDVEDNPDEVLRIIKNIVPPVGALDYYSDYYYSSLVNYIIEQAVLLNKTLDKQEQIKEVNDLSKFEVLQKKKHVSPKELSQLFPNMSISQQQTYRGRLKDKIPYHQSVNGGKITYVVSEVEEWRENNNIR